MVVAMQTLSGDPPTVKAYKLARSNHFVVLCPHCRRLHYHGAAGGGGHVASHCSDSAAARMGYVLAPAGIVNSGSAVMAIESGGRE